MNLLAAMIQAEMTADEIATFQMGTHPLLTASPVAYQVVNAAELALEKMHQADRLGAPLPCRPGQRGWGVPIMWAGSPH